jgi:hypothetical protein
MRPKFRQLGLVSLSVFSWAPFSLAAAMTSSFPQGPVPAWVRPLSVPEGASSLSSIDRKTRATREHTTSFRYLIYDDQQKFDHRSLESFLHVAYVVDKPSDVQYGSELEAHYNPPFEELTLHFARIHRRGEVINALRAAEIQVLRQESDRERFMYDAGEDVVAVLKDVRRGDVIEWAYSTKGQNPALAGHVLSTSRLASAASVKASLVRLLVAKNTRIQYRVHGTALAPQVETQDSFTEYRWLQSEVLAVDDEGDTPEWFVAEPWVEFSDFSSWAEVSAWALPLYVEPKSLPKELENLIVRWQQIGSDAQKVATVLRFVQDELRYLGMEIGPHSLKPHSPIQTFEQRFGDCKDKTLLLVTVLHRLGINAVPALVASSDGRLLSERIPSPYAFDHVIAKVTIGNDVYWLDPTVQSDGGDLSSKRYSDFHFALPIAKNTVALEPLSHEPLSKPLCEVEEHYELGNLTQPTILTVQTRLRGSRATEFRARYEPQGVRDLKRDYLNFFAKRFETIESESDPSVFDDETANEISIIEHYRIERPFEEDDNLSLSPWSFDETLEAPEIVRRRSPLGVNFPYHAVHRIVISSDVTPPIELPNVEVADEVVKFSAHGKLENNGRRATVSYALTTTDDFVPVQKVREHLALRRRMDARASVHILRSVVSKDANASNPVSLMGFIVVGVGVLITVLSVASSIFIRQRRRVEAVVATSKPKEEPAQLEDSSVTS